ncbi:hypothetical protein, partial [Streptomyces sp. SID1034]
RSTGAERPMHEVSATRRAGAGSALRDVGTYRAEEADRHQGSPLHAGGRPREDYRVGTTLR